MRYAKALVLAAALVGFAGPAFAGPGGCGGASHETAQTVVDPSGQQTVVAETTQTAETRK